MDKTILVLDQHEMDPSVDNTLRDSYYQRTAVRAVLKDISGKIALMYAKQRDYYKLPGGGVDEGEGLEQALERELLEETGSKANVKRQLGQVIEWRDIKNMKQTSYAFEAVVVGKIRSPDFTQSEIDEGFEMRWASDLNEAIMLVEAQITHDDLEVMFMTRRDAAILRAAS